MTAVTLFPLEDKYKKGRIIPDEYSAYINGMCVGIIHSRKDYRQKYYFHSDNGIYANYSATLAEMKRNIAKGYEETVREGKFKSGNGKQAFDIKYLPEGDNSEFFPTPKSVCGQMIGCVNWSKVKTILEPSAGKGDLCDAVKNYYKQSRNERSVDIDCVEVDANLRLILKGKNYRVVHDNFLDYFTSKKYDLIIMNPPFSNGDEHLVRAIEMQECVGGQIVCLLNAETLLNPYTNLRKVLMKKIAEHRAVVRYLKSPFKKAERKTDTNIALISFNIPLKVRESEMFSRMEKARGEEFQSEDCKDVAPGDRIEGLVRAYEIESEASLAFLREWDALRPKIMTGSDWYSKPTIGLMIGGSEVREGIDTEVINNFLQSVRLKYWKQLLDLPEIGKQMTTAIRTSYDAKINDMANYEFSMFNIQEVIWDIRVQLQMGVEDEILRLFDKLSNEHCYYEGNNENIHYYNGWKTNKAHKVNYKVIIPAYGSFAHRYDYDKYQRLVEKKNDFIDSRSCCSVLADLEKTLDYLDGKDPKRTRCDLANRLHFAERRGETRNIDCTYFYVTFYKKGTCHITFRDDAKILIDRLNIYAGKNKNWLPPNYGRASYKSMTEEERAVVDSFDGGEENYNKVFENQKDYLIESNGFLALAAGGQ